MYEQSFSANDDDDEVGTALPLPAELRELCPNIALALSGRVGSKKQKTRPIAPATIIIFARDGGVGFVVAPKDSPKNAHGFLQEPYDLIQGIEAALANNRIGWKPASRKRS